MKNKIRAIALYLPQFHPIPENDLWWGKGFTEWTNVGKAKRLFPGHEQPRVPTELGYYDLRVPETRQAQAEMAREAGVEGFAYWHYWFGGGKTLLERPFREVLESGKPDFPFCLAWANHSWYDKTWNKDGTDRLLIEQTYPGDEDYEQHFLYVLKAFQDPRYIRVDEKPVFMVYEPCDSPKINDVMDLWRDLAVRHGLPGVYFIALAHWKKDLAKLREFHYDAVSYDPLFDFRFERKTLRSLVSATAHKVLGIPKIQRYKDYVEYFRKHFPQNQDYIPAVNPNYDHTPRSGKYGVVLVGDTPEVFGELLKTAGQPGYLDHHKLMILRSWNEWAEGNYLEPDLRHGRGYLDALKLVLREKE